MTPRRGAGGGLRPSTEDRGTSTTRLAGASRSSTSGMARYATPGRSSPPCDSCSWV